MRTKLYSLILAVILALGCWSCKKSKEAEVAKGDVQVLVSYQDLPQYPDGAEIYSDPPGISGFTDGTPSILIRGVPVGTYQIYCYKNGYGGGKSAVHIMEGQLTAALIILIPGYDPGVAPIIDYVYPSDNSQYSPSDSIIFAIQAHDGTTAPEKLSVKAQSNIDGVIYQGHLNSAGFATFKKKLSKNTHIITFTVTNSHNFSAHAIIRILMPFPEKIHLNTPVVSKQGVQLSWTKYTGSDFDRYEVYTCADRILNNPTLVGTVNDVSTTTYTDASPPVTDTGYYYVTVVNKNSMSSPSNLQAVPYPSGYILCDIISVCMDPAGTFIYAADNHSVLKFNYLTNTMVAQWNYPGGSIPGGTRVKLEVADNGLGKELYVCLSGGAVYFVNAETMTTAYQINANPGIIDISTNGDGFIYMVPKWDLFSQYGMMVSFKRTTTQYVDSIHFTNNNGVEAIHCVPGKNEVVTLHGYLFMHIYHDANGQFNNLSNHTLAEGLQDSQLFPFSFSPNGNFFLTGTETRIYNTDNYFTYRGMFDSYGGTNCGCADQNNNIYVPYPNDHIVVKSTYPNTGGTTFYHSQGNPTYVMTDGTNLVVLSRTSNPATTCYVVEVVPLTKKMKN